MRPIALAWLLSATLARAANRTVGPTDSQIEYHGAWNSSITGSGAVYQLSRDANATATFAFTGSAVYVLSTGSGRGGPAVITVDAGIDNAYQYTIVGSAEEGSVLYARTGLVASSAHVIQIEALGGGGPGPGAPIEVYGFIFDDGSAESTTTDTDVPSTAAFATHVSTFNTLLSTVFASGSASGVFSVPYYTSGTGSASPSSAQASSLFFPPSTSLSTHTSTPSYPAIPSSSHHADSAITIGGVVVGALGGAVLGVLATLLVLRCLRQRRRKLRLETRGRFVPMAHEDESRVGMGARAHLRMPSSRSSWTAAVPDPFVDDAADPFSAEPSSVSSASDMGSSLTAHSRADSHASGDTVRTAVFAPSKARGSGSSGSSGAPPEYSSSRGSGSRYMHEKYEVDR